MARLIKCPRCQAQVDVSTNAGGATVPCPDCGVQLRVPTGETGKYQKVPEPAAASTGKKGDTAFRARTPIMAKMGGAKGYSAPGTRMPSRNAGGGYERGANARGSNNLPLIIGGVVAGVALIVVLVVALGNNKPVEKPKRVQQPIADAPEPDPEPENPTPAGTNEPPKKKPALQKEGGKYVAPDTFERGADKFRQGTDPQKVEAALQSQTESLLKAGNYKEIITGDHKYFPALLNCFIADDETLARKAFECIRDWCDAKSLKTESGKNPINIELFNSAQWRGGAFAEWSDWYTKNKDAMDPSVVNGPRNVSASSIDWAKFATMLRSGGQGYDDEKRPEGAVMATLKAIRVRIAVENLAPLMAPDGAELDLMAARGINAALEHLTGQKMPALNAGNVGEIKKRWLEWASKQP